MLPIELHNQGVLLAREGRYEKAVERFSAAANAGVRASYKALFSTLINAHRFAEAWQTGRQYLLLADDDYAFATHFCKEVAHYAERARPTYRPVPVTSTPFLSFVICSRDDERFAAVYEEICRAAGAYPHEIVRVPDAVSMADGYRRGLAHSKGNIVILCHDDIRFAIPDFIPRLLTAMENADMVGLVGSQRMTGPAMIFDGHPYIVGRIINPLREDAAGDKYKWGIGSMTVLRCKAQVLDGAFIAARRPLLEGLGFDASIPHFHYYDIDLSYRAHLVGARVVAATDLTLVHASTGTFDHNWVAAKEAFERKFPALWGTPGKANHWYQVHFSDPSLFVHLSQAFNDALA
jgi:hypothetical protein